MSEEMGENSLNPRHSLSDDSESHKKQILQPIRIKALLDMYENDDDDSDNKNDDSEEENNELEICKPLAPINETTCNDNLEVLKQSCESKNYPVMEKEPSGNLRKLSNYPILTSEQNFSWKNYAEEKNYRRASASKELCYSKENLQHKTKICQPIDEFTSDFGRIEIDGLRAGITPSSETCVVEVSQAEPTTSVTCIKLPSTNSITLKCEMAISTAASCQNTKIYNSEAPESMHSIIDKHMHGVVSYKSSDHSIVPNESSQINKDLSTISATPGMSNVPGTPLKLHPIGGGGGGGSSSGRRPMTHSTSRRTMFQTPQGKISTDLSKTSHEQTPASIFSTWRHGNKMHTPMQNKIEPLEIETPGKCVMVKNETPWKFQNCEKRVRRPLEETIPSEQPSPPSPPQQFSNDNPVHLPNKDNNNIAPQVNIIEEKNVETSMHYEVKENLGPINIELSKNKSQLNVQSPTLKNGRKICPIIEYAPVIQTHSKLVKKPDGHSSHQSISITTPNLPYQYGKKISVKGKEYIILGTLGQGMSGEVYRVQDITNLELKAIKYVNLARMDQESAQSCLNEIKMLNKLQAPSVVTMFDHEVKNQSIYVVMEMGDTDLSRFLKSLAAEKRTLPLTMILYYWTEMLTAVKHIHDNGVIHSDLKPANFLLVRGRLKLIDFGISSSLNGEMTSVVKNTTVGTLNYISPEALMDVGGSNDSPHQNNKYKISYKSDVWSLGCILYSLVYGNTPFHNIRQQWAKINAITNPNPRISYSLPPHVENVPSILIDVIRKCLQHDPKARPSVDQLLQVQYISVAKNVSITCPDIPPSILMKIKHTLDDPEWRIFTEILGQLRHH